MKVTRVFCFSLFFPVLASLTSGVLYPSLALSSCNAVVFHVESGAEDLATYVPSDLSSPSSRWGGTVHALWVQEYENILAGRGPTCSQRSDLTPPPPNPWVNVRIPPSIYGSPFMDLLVSSVFMRFSCCSIIYRYTHYHSSSIPSLPWDPIWQLNGHKLQVNQYWLTLTNFLRLLDIFPLFHYLYFRDPFIHFASSNWNWFCGFKMVFNFRSLMKKMKYWEYFIVDKIFLICLFFYQFNYQVFCA